MIFLWFSLTCVLGYKEVLTFIPVDALNTISIINFTDSVHIKPSNFMYLEGFPEAIIEILQETESFSSSLTWGIGEAMQSRLLDYYSHTGRLIQISQPGLSILSSHTNWPSFLLKLNNLLGTSVLHQPPLHLPLSFYWHTNDFLCIENILKISQLLPCREKGLNALFEQLMSSKYLSVILQGQRTEDFYKYSLIITALKKDQYSGIINSCETSIELYENSLEEYPTSLRLSKIGFSPVKSGTKAKVESKRRLLDEEHGFSATFIHDFKNNLQVPQKLTVYEWFPKATVPLLSSINHRIDEIVKEKNGWVLKFDLSIPPGEFSLIIKLEKKILGFEEYPNDPQRGWDVLPMPILTSSEMLVSNGLLIMIPEPDFSMPFNVICITGTILAFFFTSMQSLQTWKDSVHWSNENYEKSILKAKKIMGVIKNMVLAISLIVLFILDQKGIIKMFG